MQSPRTYLRLLTPSAVLLACGVIATWLTAASAPDVPLLPLSGLCVAVLLRDRRAGTLPCALALGATALLVHPSAQLAAAQFLGSAVVVGTAASLFRIRYAIEHADATLWVRDVTYAMLASAAGALLGAAFAAMTGSGQISSAHIGRQAVAHLSGLLLFIPLGVSALGADSGRLMVSCRRFALWGAGFWVLVSMVPVLAPHALVLGSTAVIVAGMRTYRAAGSAWEAAGISAAWLALAAAGAVSVAQGKDLALQVLLLALISSALRLVRNASRLQASRLDALMNQTFDLVAEFSEEGRILSVNPGFKSLLGWAPDELLGSDGWQLSHPDDRAGAAQHLGDSPIVRTRLRCRDGSWKWVNSSQAEYRSPGGELRRLAVARDVTAEVEHQQSLEQARRDAEAASRAKSLFLASMSHEIRTPIASILGYIELLQDASSGDAATVGSLDSIQRNGRHLLALVNGLLDLSKIEADELSLQRVATSPAEIAQDAIAIFAHIAEDKGIELEYVCEPGVPDWIQGDPDRLRQILVNLIGNATKFTSEGGVQLMLSTGGEETHPKVYFSVTDTGPGIAPESLETVFDPFVQADTSLSRTTGGAGLGLAISLRLAQLLGGQIRASSEVGRGSEFLLEIPYEIASAPCHGQVDLDAQPCAGQSILLAEDSMDNQRLLRAFLGRAGAQVTIASDGVQAVAAVREQLADSDPPDLILMDIQMPELDGHAATEQIRSLGYAGPIIALSAHATREDRERALAAGCDDYLTKPIDREVLIGRVASFLSKSQEGAT